MTLSGLVVITTLLPEASVNVVTLSSTGSVTSSVSTSSATLLVASFVTLLVASLFVFWQPTKANIIIKISIKYFFMVPPKIL